MVLSSSSPAAARFLAAIREGHGLKGSARMSGIDKEVGYRFLRDRYLALRRDGMSTLDAVDTLGVRSSRVASWEAMVGHDGRHHLRVEAAREQSFWHAFDSGSDVAVSARAAGVSMSTGYRWLERRFVELRVNGIGVAGCARRLRLSDSGPTRSNANGYDCCSKNGTPRWPRTGMPCTRQPGSRAWALG